MENLNIKEKSLLRIILKEHKDCLIGQIKETSQKDKHSLEKEEKRVDDIIHKLKLN